MPKDAGRLSTDSTTFLHFLHSDGCPGQRPLDYVRCKMHWVPDPGVLCRCSGGVISSPSGHLRRRGVSYGDWGGCEPVSTPPCTSG